MTKDWSKDVMAGEWNALDWFIARVRYRKILGAVSFDGDNIVVCDIGCGAEGKFLSWISPKISRGYGFDMKTADGAHANIRLRQVDDLQEGIPLENASVDYVFLIAVLEHLDAPGRMFAEISRILKPGGKLVLTTPTPRGKSLLEFMAFGLHIINQEEILDHKHYYIEKEIRNLCGEAGLDMRRSYRKFWFGMNSIACAVKETGNIK